MDMLDDKGGALPASGPGQSAEPEPEVSALRVTVPNAEWPMWAAAIWCEAFVNGSISHVMALKFVRAPDRDSAKRGAEKMLGDEYPNGSDFQALVSKVPA